MDAEGVALVTGASRGIGRAVAIDLARAGFDVVAGMRNPDDGADLADLVGDGSGSVVVTRLDMDDPSTMDIPQGLRVLVNNAAIERQYLPVEEVEVDEWRAVFETNLFGLVELTKRAIPEMRRGEDGVICNVTSSSILVAIPFYSIYRASKAAVSAMSETLRCEVADFGIRVVEIMPGPVDTDMLARSDRIPEAVDSDGYREMAEATHAARRAIAGMVIPAPVAAERIRSIILDDHAGLKHGIDDISIGLLDAWSTNPISLVGTPYGTPDPPGPS